MKLRKKNTFSLIKNINTEKIKQYLFAIYLKRFGFFSRQTFSCVKKKNTDIELIGVIAEDVNHCVAVMVSFINAFF